MSIKRVRLWWREITGRMSLLVKLLFLAITLNIVLTTMEIVNLLLEWVKNV